MKTKLFQPTEHEIQSAYFDWVKMMEGRNVLFSNIFAIPNGGLRHTVVAYKLKREGARAGIPDVFIAIPSDEFHGMFLEFKTHKGRLSQAQFDCKKFLERENFKVVVVRSVEEAIAKTTEYLRGRNK